MSKPRCVLLLRLLCAEVTPRTQAYVAAFMAEMHKNFPNMIIQFEDFHTTLAFPVLKNNVERYPFVRSFPRRDSQLTSLRHSCFNDDVRARLCPSARTSLTAHSADPRNGRRRPLGRDSRVPDDGNPSQGPAHPLLRRWLLGRRSRRDDLPVLCPPGDPGGGREEHVLARRFQGPFPLLPPLHAL